MNFVVAVFIIQWLKSNCNQNFWQCDSHCHCHKPHQKIWKYEVPCFDTKNEGGQLRETGCIGGSELAIHKQIDRLPALPEMVSSFHLSWDVHQGYSDTPHWVQWMPKLVSFKTFPHSQFLSHKKIILVSFVLTLFPFRPAKWIKSFVFHKWNKLVWFLLSFIVANEFLNFPKCLRGGRVNLVS